MKPKTRIDPNYGADDICKVSTCSSLIHFSYSRIGHRIVRPKVAWKTLRANCIAAELLSPTQEVFNAKVS